MNLYMYIPALNVIYIYPNFFKPPFKPLNNYLFNIWLNQPTTAKEFSRDQWTNIYSTNIKKT